MKLDIWSILIIVFIFQGIFLLVSLLISPKRRKKKENKYLLILIIILLWYLLEFLSVRNTFNIGLNVFYGTRYGSWFLLGPITFFYFKSITETDFKFSYNYLLHFVPFIVFTLLIPLFSDEILNRRQVHYGMLSVFDHRDKVISPLQYLYSYIFIIQFVHLGFYLFKNLRNIKQYSIRLHSEYAHYDTNVKWLRILNITLLSILLFSAVFLYLLLVTDVYRRYLDYIYVLPIGILFYLIGYHLMNVEWKVTGKKPVKYAKSSLAVEEVPLYLEKLNVLMKDEKIYLDSDIRLKDLAKKLHINSHHLSQIINQHCNLSFFDFINQNRIEEAKTIITNNPDKPLIQVAFDSGFNNKTSFVNSFKKFEKLTPSKFRDAIVTS